MPRNRAVITENSKLPSPSAFPPIGVAAVGLHCLAGDQAFALLGAVSAPVSGVRPSAMSIPGESSEVPLLSAPVPELEGLLHPQERMEHLLQNALLGVLADLPADLDPGCLLVLILLPGPSTTRGQALDHALLEAALRGLHPNLGAVEIRFVPADEGSCEHLERACRELGEKRWQSVLFGGVDSLVDVVTCSELAGAGRVMTPDAGDGLAPGEAAAFILLHPDTANSRVKMAVRGVGTAPEPHARAADRMPMKGLVAAMKQGLNQAAIAIEGIGAIVHPRGGEAVDALEWHQVRRQLWPPQKMDRNIAFDKSPTELRPHRSIGEIGAASLPVMLALAFARFEFKHPKISGLAICEVGDHPIRGAVILTPS